MPSPRHDQRSDRGPYLIASAPGRRRGRRMRRAFCSQWRRRPPTRMRLARKSVPISKRLLRRPRVESSRQKRQWRPSSPAIGCEPSLQPPRPRPNHGNPGNHPAGHTARPPAFSRRLETLASLLARQPAIGRRTDLQCVRVFALRPYPYPMFYRIDPDDSGIIVLRIRHMARKEDWRTGR